jgi:hypothetical protein
MMAVMAERPRQQLAEGGLVRGLVRKVMGIPEPTPAPVAAPAPAPAPAPAAPAPAPTAGAGISGYAGNGSLDRRMKDAGLKDGGPVRGPGTGTSDSIPKESKAGSYIMPADSTAKIGEGALAKMGKVPVNLSNGEYELPPEQVHAIGVQTLEHMKNATHTPAAQQQLADGGIVDDPRRKPNSFGDAAAAAQNPGVSKLGMVGQPPTLPNPGATTPPQAPVPKATPIASAAVAAPTGYPQPTYQAAGTPASFTPPGGGADAAVAKAASSAATMLAAPPPVFPTISGAPPTGHAQPTYQASGTPTSAPVPTAKPAVDAMDPSKTGAAFGIYPNPNSNISTHANDARLARGVTANADRTGFQPAQPLSVAPLRFGATNDPRSTQYAGAAGTSAASQMAAPAAAAAPAAPAPVPVEGAATMRQVYDTPRPAEQASVRAADNAINVGQPTDLAVTDERLASTSGRGPAPAANGGRPFALGSAEDTAYQTKRLQDSNASSTPPGGPTMSQVGPTDYANRNAAFNEQAELRTAARQGSWSPRRGYQGNDDAVKAATIPMVQRARADENALNAQTLLAGTTMREEGDTKRATMRDTGDTTRTNIRESGDNARALMADARGRETIGIQRGELGIRQTTADLANTSQRRINDAQAAILAAKTPEEQRTASDRMAALSGKDPNKFSVHEIGGGSQVDEKTGLAVPQPKGLVVYNQRDGSAKTLNANDAAQAKVPQGMTQIGTSGGKPVYQDAKGNRFTG